LNNFYRIFFFALPEAYLRRQELNAYTDLANTPLTVFAQWNTWQPSSAVRERELCSAMRGGP
jgi:hypothetical protein